MFTPFHAIDSFRCSANASVQLLIKVCLFVLMAESSSFAAVVGIWTFEHGVDNTSASGIGSVLDYSGNGNNGTPLGSPYYHRTSLGNGTIAMGFASAPHQKVFFADSAAFQITQSITIEAVIRFDGTAAGNSFGHNMILLRGDDRGGLDPYFMSVNSGRIMFGINNTAVLYSAPLIIGQWYRVAGVLDDATGRQSLFVDNIEVAHAYTSQRPTQFLDPSFYPGVAIGGAQSNNFQFGFGGLIDEVRLYDSAVNYNSTVPEPMSMLVWTLGGLLGMLSRMRSKRH